MTSDYGKRHEYIHFADFVERFEPAINWNPSKNFKLEGITTSQTLSVLDRHPGKTKSFVVRHYLESTTTVYP